MSWSKACQSQFLNSDRLRGDQYFRAGFVQLDAMAANELVAFVQGSDQSPYRVVLNLELDPSMLLRVSCTCPRFAEGYACKHLWATLRAADDVEWLDSSISLPRRLRIALENNLRSRPQAIPVSAARSVLVRDRASPPRRRELRSSTESVTDRKSAKPSAPSWTKHLAHLKSQLVLHANQVRQAASMVTTTSPKQHWFVICIPDQPSDDHLTIRTYAASLKADGTQAVPQLKAIREIEIDAIPDALERQALERLFRVQTVLDDIPYYEMWQRKQHGLSQFELPADLTESILPMLAATGRFGWTLQDQRFLTDFEPLTWDAGATWRLVLHFGSTPDSSESIRLTQRLERGDEHLSLDQFLLAANDGLVVFRDRLLRISSEDASWLRTLIATQDEFTIPRGDFDTFLQRFVSLPNIPLLNLDPLLGVSETVEPPKARFMIAAAAGGSRTRFVARCEFIYGDVTLAAGSLQSSVWNLETRRLIHRDIAREAEYLRHLAALPLSLIPSTPNAPALAWDVNIKSLPVITKALIDQQWEVFVEGQQYRVPARSAGQLQVESGIDWFDVHGTFDYGDAHATLPEILSAIRRKQSVVRLDDGTLGILPDTWIRRYTRLAEQATTNDDGAVRFGRSQGLLLEMLLAEQGPATFDVDFERYCKRLHNFQGITPATAPRGFRGELRPYQREGLGWLHFLREMRFGGCLADDMGLGKTIQVLALLQSRRIVRKNGDGIRRPTLIVVPKSLVFNWLDEASRFTPKLRFLNHTGAERTQEDLLLTDAYDVVLTTYGTLRRDIVQLKEIHFDYVILDEAQAIKNAGSQAAQACRLLQADHRLAMTGTPIENHLGELWSLLDFLNPGMIPSVASLKSLAQVTAPTGDADTASTSMSPLARALRPFMLRRTKTQVLQDLPEKTEQTLYCEMLPKQRSIYSSIREHYRRHLSKKIQELGIQRSKIHVLEALLRLRQVACDPRLIDNDQKSGGAKLDLLLERLEELLNEGHKALVFSQFTSYLALVRQALDSRNWVYEYLDGKTTDRAARVKRFQEDATCPLFLISLKAGGQGLNLTAADYVFILDPWWNPAVEAQAIDRAHRLGQTRSVVAYRIICRETVEEKIIELQANKRELAEAVVAADNSLLSNLSLDDLTLLLES